MIKSKKLGDGDRIGRRNWLSGSVSTEQARLVSLCVGWWRID